MKDIKILDAIWFTPMGSYKPIGIVTCKTEHGSPRAFIGFGEGDDEKFDAEQIASKGAEVHVEMLESLIGRLR